MPREPWTDALDPVMPRLVLYQYPRAGRLESISPFCVKVHLALRFKGLPYDVVDLTSPRRVRRTNPRGRMPALAIDGEVVVDSSEILLELERRFPEPALLPADPVLRARARILEDWADELLYFYVLYWRWRIEPPDPAKAFRFLPTLVRPLGFRLIRGAIVRRLNHQGMGVRPVEQVEREVRDALSHVAVLLGAGRSGFLLDTPAPSLADVAVFAMVDGLYWNALPRAMALVDGFPAVMAWYRAVNAATRERAAP